MYSALLSWLKIREIERRREDEDFTLFRGGSGFVRVAVLEGDVVDRYQRVGCGRRSGE